MEEQKDRQTLFHWTLPATTGGPISVYILAICANFRCQIQKFELEVAHVGILGT